MSSEPVYKAVNLTDRRQDIHLVRKERLNLNRFRIAESLLPKVADGNNILEVGGGAAEFSRRLGDLGFKVTFVDLSDANVSRAREFGMQAHQIDLNAGLPGLGTGLYDGVIMLEIIEHVVAAEQLLNEVARVLKPGGFLILSTPNFAYWGNRLRIAFGGLSRDEGYHFRFFTPRVLEKRLISAGLIPETFAHTTPAVGLNFFWNKIAGKPRLHVKVPRFVAPFMAHTLVVRARKKA